MIIPYPFQDYRLILVDLRGAGKSPNLAINIIPSIDQADLIYQFILEHDLKKSDSDGKFIWRRRLSAIGDQAL